MKLILGNGQFKSPEVGRPKWGLCMKVGEDYYDSQCHIHCCREIQGNSLLRIMERKTFYSALLGGKPSVRRRLHFPEGVYLFSICSSPLDLSLVKMFEEKYNLKPTTILIPDELISNTYHSVFGKEGGFRGMPVRGYCIVDCDRIWLNNSLMLSIYILLLRLTIPYPLGDICLEDYIKNISEGIGRVKDDYFEDSYNIIGKFNTIRIVMDNLEIFSNRFPKGTTKRTRYNWYRLGINSLVEGRFYIKKLQKEFNRLRAIKTN